MKALIFSLALAMSCALYAQDDGYTMYETVYLKPDMKHLKTLAANMKAHNDKYHSTAPYYAGVRSIENGPNVGNLVWIMGPCTFTDLDSRPAGEHDTDWRDNVLPYIVSQKHGEYWKRDDDMSVIDPDPTTPSPLIRVRFYEIAKGQLHRVQGVLSKIKPAVEAMEGDDNYRDIFVNEFLQGYGIGRHIAVVSGYSGWAEVDEEGDSFIEAFDEVHGNNAFNVWIQEMNEVFADVYDEYWSAMPNMSATLNE